MVDVGGQPIDRYVVLQHLSEGGMGAIYVGKKLGAGGFEMEVVLKQLLPEFTQQEEFIDLFLREAKLSATLDHANIVHTIDLVTAGGEYFIVMEYLPGGDLRTLLKRAKRRGRRFSPAAAIYITREVAAALAYAHVKRDWNGTPLQLIHRDVSPSNILVSYAGEVKLTDFGIAKASTHTSQFYKVKGKIGYMSPEQAKSETLDSRSDLYSLAVCLYEIVSGERLFVAAGLTTSAEEIYSQPVPSLAKKIPGLPVELDQIIQRALAIDPARRYQTAGELNEALTRCAHRNGLLMSAPELAQELLADCGPTEQWRDEDEEDDLESHARPGTEIYDVSGDDDDDADEENEHEREIESPIIGMLGMQAARAKAARTPSGERAKTEVGKFHGVELTSIINLMDIEAAGRALDGGSPPSRTIDVDSGPKRMSVAQLAMQPMPTPPPPPLPGTSMASPPPPPVARRVAPAVETAVVVDQKKRAAALAAANSGSLGQPSRLSRRKKRSLTPVLVIVAVLLAAGIAAVVVALSGPSIAAEKNK